MRNGPEKQPKAAWQVDAAETAEPGPGEDYVFPTPRGVLSAAEIEALLRPNLQKPALETPENVVPKPSPEFYQSDESSSLQVDDADRVLGARLSRAMGEGTGLKAGIVPTQSATLLSSDLAGLLHGKSAAIACVGPKDGDIRALICLPGPLADAIIAKACGARGSTGRIGDGWTLSAIDCALLEQLLVPFGPALGPDMVLQSIETDVPYVSGLLPAHEVSVSEFSIEAPCLHADLALIRADELFEQDENPYNGVDAAPITALATARLARLSVPLSRVTELKAGSTLLLGLPADQPVELLSGDRDGAPAYEGRMGRKGNRVAVKITKRLKLF
ncbi:MAG: FliM/FliN family flagellar motor C-terminal domain-containing protein [Pseudomonadota bacterium]|nr:FliM/FliN family flagellar motor C-terminal domain-containing protein [Pseudomonadota bacterium]